MKLEYYKNLDGLRAISALMVVVFHFFTYRSGFYSDSFYAPDNWFFRNIIIICQHGVSLFFVLSGFVITRILLKTKDESYYFQNFYTKRILRIAPLYYLFLVVWFYILPAILDKPTATIDDQLPSFLYLQNILSTFSIKESGPPHFWSLAVEEHFYLAWPFVVFFTPFNKLGTVIFISILGVFVVKFFMLKNGLNTHDFTLTRIDQILMGAFLTILEVNGIFKRTPLKYFVSLAVLIVPIAFGIYMLSPAVPFLKDMTKYFLLGLICFSFLGMVLSLKKESQVNKFLTLPALQYLGKISYGIYVWHALVLILLYNFFLTEAVAVDLAIALLLTIGFAHLSYFYFEKVFLNMKEKIPSGFRQVLWVRRKTIWMITLVNRSILRI
jgi:peptidoglycan/LPS O-acetylase OafA/YrhL